MLTCVAQNLRVSAVAVGTHHGVLVASEGAVYTWGVGACGQLGHGDADGRSEPTLVAALRGSVAVQVAAGHAHTLVLTKVGRQSVGAYRNLTIHLQFTASPWTVSNT